MKMLCFLVRDSRRGRGVTVMSRDKPCVAYRREELVIAWMWCVRKRLGKMTGGSWRLECREIHISGNSYFINGISYNGKRQKNRMCSIESRGPMTLIDLYRSFKLLQTSEWSKSRICHLLICFKTARSRVCRILSLSSVLLHPKKS